MMVLCKISVVQGETLSREGHSEKFIATGARIYYIYIRFKNFNKNSYIG